MKTCVLFLANREKCSFVNLKFTCCLVWYIMLASLPHSANAQPETSTWYFGHRAGIVFNEDSSVKALKDGEMVAFGGCASIADKNGRLLFYTNGIQVWNRKHRVMPKGSGLFSHHGAAQAAIIIPKPHSQNIYYIFTVAANGTRDLEIGAHYSEIDMSLDSGLGDVTSVKNVNLVSKTDEKLTAVKHKNGRDIWVLIAERYSSLIHAFLVTPDGVQTTPVKSNIGFRIDGGSGIMKVSPDGEKLAMTLIRQDTLLIGSFNSGTGQAGKMFGIRLYVPFGLEFSPNSSLLYVTREVNNMGDECLLQFNLALPTEQLIRESKFCLVRKSYGDNGWIIRPTGLQLAMNKRIYFCLTDNYRLGSINNPDALYNDCMIDLNAVDFKERKITFGLPNFIPSFFTPFDFRWTATVSDCRYHARFTVTDTGDITSYRWHFGDPHAKTGENESDSFQPEHVYSQGGHFNVTLIIKRRNHTDTIRHLIHLNPWQNATDFPDSVRLVCPDSSALIGFEQPGATYLWNTGESKPFIRISEKGLYWLILTDSNGCKFSDSFHLAYFKVTKPQLGPDIRICGNDSAVLEDLSGKNFKKYMWNTGQVSGSVIQNQQGTYSLTVWDDNLCASSDTMYLSTLPFPYFDLGKDTTLCEGQTLEIGHGLRNVSGIWQDGDTASGYKVTKPGKYTLTLKDGNCSFTDQIMVNVAVYPDIELGGNDSFCGFFNKELDGGQAEKHVWNTGETGRFIVAQVFGTYSVKAFNSHCMSRDSIVFSPRQKPPVFIPTAFTPNGDALNEILMADKSINIQDISIYNRWGQLVYVHKSGVSWDGTYKEMNCPEGVYLICFSYTDCLNQPINFHQTVHLIR